MGTSVLGIFVTDPGEPVLIVTLAIIAALVLSLIVYAVKRRGRKRWWQGQNAPADEPFFYQRRDDSGQG